jgi:PRTRC genetic system ThiF family protein
VDRLPAWSAAVTYVVEPAPVRVAGQRRDELNATIVLVGCGGTGGFLAEALARLLLGRRAALFLVDPDCVAPENLGRQAFRKADLCRFKAEVLAQRLAADFGCEVGYSVLPYEARVHAAAFDRPSRLGLVIGAVDNAAARRAIAATLDEQTARPFGWGSPPPVLWLDVGNGYNSGQVLLGNALRREQLRRAFDPWVSVCRALPAPSLQRPDLLQAPPADAQPQATCALAIVRAEQSATINQVMAALATSYVERLLEGRCTWMASYLDVDNGTLQCVPADPRQVASVLGERATGLLQQNHRRAIRPGSDRSSG